ncbi:hypothetical protein Back11_37980 [Paenibacillus baekrokdamisoli]|uniref:Uncharacterized protein n=1 Tax=Paenibacillus baekrokdamisoli TaxID=1712516 RepID=A0A3G9JBY6_9BACL|nr:hypothetical protein [Paenibacillus baekrokdamisoli]MBB3068506.1 hypothetical protein [Paenibacillus baekrokdamisoli]BBH22453.1 hypothetical protein Back11_37980 [Paenibacillus baekrokdamisoli]
MKKTRIPSKSIFAFIITLSFILVPTTSFGAVAQRQTPLTSPPPTEIRMQGFFESNNKYLDQGDVSIKDNLDQTVTITVSTVSKSTVSSIGATIYLQKYTGSTWIDVGPATTITGSNKWYFTGEAKKTTTKGYYFRARTVHWVSNNGTYEQGEITSDYILAN